MQSLKISDNYFLLNIETQSPFHTFCRLTMPFSPDLFTIQIQIQHSLLYSTAMTGGTIAYLFTQVYPGL